MNWKRIHGELLNISAFAAFRLYQTPDGFGMWYLEGLTCMGGAWATLFFSIDQGEIEAILQDIQDAVSGGNDAQPA